MNNLLSKISKMDKKLLMGIGIIAILAIGLIAALAIPQVVKLTNSSAKKGNNIKVTVTTGNQIWKYNSSVLYDVINTKNTLDGNVYYLDMKESKFNELLKEGKIVPSTYYDTMQYYDVVEDFDVNVRVSSTEEGSKETSIWGMVQ